MAHPIREKLDSEESLNLLREISVDPRLTQREMSSRLNLSLGKINFLIKAMIEKGLVKVENFKNSENKAAYLYFLTPVGIEEKARITLRFLKRKTEEYERLKLEIQRLEKEAAAENTFPDNRSRL
jgi:EPS-associated MarR family transcriptional regulator